MTKSEKSKRMLEQSMLAYSQKMTAINKGRLSLQYGKESTPNERRTTIPKRTIRLNIPTSVEHTFEMLSSRLASPPHKRLAPIKGYNSQKINKLQSSELTLYGNENRSILQTENKLNDKETEIVSKRISTISPPEIKILQASRENTLDDILADETCSMPAEEDVELFENSEIRDMSSRESFVSISPFPEYKDNMAIDGDFGNLSNKVSKSHKAKDKNKAKDVDVTPRKSKRQHLKSPEKNKNDKTNKELAKKRKKEEEKKTKKEVMEVFRYSFAVEKLMDKPDPSFISDKDIVYKVEKDTDGLEVRTLGPAVLTPSSRRQSICSRATSRSQSRNST